LAVIKQLFGQVPSYRQARIMARLACLAVTVRGLFAVVVFFAFRPTRDQVVNQLQRIRGPVTLDASAVDTVLFDRVADVFDWISGTVTAIIVLICIVLGVWQWHRPGPVMPIVGLAIMAVSIAAVATYMMDGHTRDILLQPQNIALMALKPFLALLLVTAYRGGRYCQQYEKKLP